jgi:ABC-type polysaccharide/polyol phosphate export permease
LLILSKNGQDFQDLQKMLSTQTAHRNVWQPLWQLPRRAELIFSFAKRELLGRYKGSALGIAWAVLRPAAVVHVSGVSATVSQHHRC